MRDLGIFYKSQKNSWNTQGFWQQTVRGFNTMATLQSRKITAVLDNCSAHTVDYTQYSSYDEVLLPPNLTAHLQRVNASIGRSFKCIYRRLFVKHLLEYVDKNMEIPECERPSFKINKAVPTYIAVKVMAKAWNLVPKTVVLNGSLSTHILAPHQRAKAEELLKQGHGKLEAAFRPQMGSSLTTEKVSAAQRAISAKSEGDAWLATLSAMEDRRGDAGIEGEEVIDLVDCPVDMTENALDLSQLKVIGEFDVHDLQAIYGYGRRVGHVPRSDRTKCCPTCCFRGIEQYEGAGCGGGAP